MPFWLVKSEPESFSWQQQVLAGVESWTGVRNHQAKRHLLAMRLGDRAFFYHSNTGKAVVGVVEVAGEAYPDPTAPNPAAPGGWVCVDVRAAEPLPVPVTLAAIRADPLLADIGLLRQSRLSVMPVSDAHWHRIRVLGGL